MRTQPYKFRVTTTVDEQEYMAYKAVYLDHGVTLITKANGDDTNGYFFPYNQLVCLEW